MPQSPCIARRKAAGLCIACGSERLGAGITKLRCAICSEKARLGQRRYTKRKQENPEAYTPDGKAARRKPTRQQKQQQWRENGLCAHCGGNRSRSDRSAGFRWCKPCRLRQRRYDAAYRVRCRLRHPTRITAGRNGVPLPLGSAVPLRTTKNLTVTVDFRAVPAIRTLMQRDRERRFQHAQSTGSHFETFFQFSRILREAILFWENRPSCPVRPALYRNYIETIIKFRVDARTLAVIHRHANDRNGNLAATVCDLLVGTANPPFTACLVSKSDTEW